VVAALEETGSLMEESGPVATSAVTTAQMIGKIESAIGHVEALQGAAGFASLEGAQSMLRGMESTVCQSSQTGIRILAHALPEQLHLIVKMGNDAAEIYASIFIQRGAIHNGEGGVHVQFHRNGWIIIRHRIGNRNREITELLNGNVDSLRSIVSDHVITKGPLVARRGRIFIRTTHSDQHEGRQNGQSSYLQVPSS
jgi:hypothetical protein